MNIALLLGNVGGNAEVKQVNNKTMVSFSLCTNEYYNNETHPSWHRIVIWGEYGAKVASKITKGRQLLVHGRIEYGKYIKDNVEKTTTTIMANKIEFVGQSSTGSENSTVSEVDYLTNQVPNNYQHTISNQPQVHMNVSSYQQQPQVQMNTSSYQQQPQVQMNTSSYQQQQPQVQMNASSYQQQPQVQMNTSSYQQQPQVQMNTSSYQQQQPQVQMNTSSYQQQPQVQMNMSNYQNQNDGIKQENDDLPF